MLECVGSTNIQNSISPVPSTQSFCLEQVRIQGLTKNVSCDEYVKQMCKLVNFAIRQLATLVKKMQQQSLLVFFCNSSVLNSTKNTLIFLWFKYCKLCHSIFYLYQYLRYESQEIMPIEAIWIYNQKTKNNTEIIAPCSQHQVT